MIYIYVISFMYITATLPSGAQECDQHVGTRPVRQNRAPHFSEVMFFFSFWSFPACLCMTWGMFALPKNMSSASAWTALFAVICSSNTHTQT